jgi:hypothetical protein
MPLFIVETHLNVCSMDTFGRRVSSFAMQPTHTHHSRVLAVLAVVDEAYQSTRAVQFYSFVQVWYDRPRIHTGSKNRSTVNRLLDIVPLRTSSATPNHSITTLP